MTTWNSPRALLFVHGIGNSTAKSYQGMELKISAILGADSGKTAFYGYAYDEYNDWFANKAKVAATVTSALKEVYSASGADGALGQTAAEYVMDVIWPILVKDARIIIQTDYLRKLKEMVADGIRSGFPAQDQKISIICHSLGCFHTYEVMHRCAAEPAQGLTPFTHGVRFENVIFMASPVMLIRSVAGKLAVPAGLACLQPGHPCGPMQQGLDVNGDSIGFPSVRNWISITGDLDPVGGHLLGKKLPWAYMDAPAKSPFTGQRSIIDDQSFFNIHTVPDWLKLVADIAAKEQAGLPVNDPHSWDGYVARHAADLKKWLLA
jgi:hypothetical protein